MRRLWTEPTVTFDGQHHRVTGAGLAPLPVQRPIPVWVGAFSRPALKRAGRLADGWFPMMAPGPKLDEAREIVAQSAIEAGRDPSTLGMEGRVTWRGDRGQAADELAQWTAAGATHVSVNTMGAGLRTVDEHLAALTAVAENITA
jgi:alkanesulfonate monooxygenase SsuD/methylene tetrahydromethanopterin reductase-like flavin-dependent oxidoreductase (luciferase family)